jgi:mono/diheme cytochrome c family protein
MKKTVEKHGFKGRYLHDADGSLTATLDAKSTAEVFVLDAKRTVVYRGAVDDQYGLGYSLEAPRETYLKDVLTSLATHQPISIRATQAPGCALEPNATKKVASEVTYHNRISRIVQDSCLECHRTGGAGPFSLEKPEELIAHQAMIRQVVEKGTMPPWFAAPSENGKPSPWANDRSLSKSDKTDLLAWLKSSRPLGNETDAPKPREFPSDWGIGKPDLVLQLPREVSVKAEGIMPYQNLIVETNLTEDKWIQALEVQPTAKSVVHHVLVFVIPPGANGEEDDTPGAEERQGFFAAYVPGNSSFSYAPGLAKKLPKGSKLRFQMHYTPNGTATKDRTKLGLIYAKEKPKHEVQVIGLVNPRLRIPPNADNHPEVATLPVPLDAKILTLMPHMHLRGKAFRYEVIGPDKKAQTLLDVPTYDFNWQLAYRYADPVIVRGGSTLKATGWYDNSKSNPANPDPSKTVRWGPQTYDEMMLGYLEFYFPTRIVP